MKAAWILGVSWGIFGVVAFASPDARADQASVTVGGRFSEPPPNDDGRANPILVDDNGRRFHLPAPEGPELYRAPVRVLLGPSGLTSGKGFGYGVGVGLDIGSGAVGGRFSAAWLRGEGTDSSGDMAPTGSSFAQYLAELTLDLHKRGPWHPELGMGAGLLHISKTGISGEAGVGTGRISLEYALGIEDADARIGASITGGLVGPADDEVKDLRGYALFDAHLAIGF